MGAETRYATGKGRTIKEAYRLLVDEDKHDKGHGSYQGALGEYNKIKEVKEFSEYIDKYDVEAICIQTPKANTNKIKTEVKNFPCKETRKWVTIYQGFDFNGPIKGITSTSQAECIYMARKYVEKNPDVRVTIEITKELQGLSPVVAEINYKPASEERLGIWKFKAAVPT